jgi:hypothetical protein
MVKATAEAFEAAKKAYTLYGWLLQEIAKQFGWEKAVEMHARIGDPWAAMASGMLREKCGERKLDAASVASTVETIIKGIGCDFEVERRTDGVTDRAGRCPVYEGLSAAGINHATIERLCTAVSNQAYKGLHTSFPELTVSMRFRPKAEGICEEEYALAK